MKYTRHLLCNPPFNFFNNPLVCLFALVLIPLALGLRNQKSSYSNRPKTNPTNPLFADQYCADSGDNLFEVLVADDVNLVKSAKPLRDGSGW